MGNHDYMEKCKIILTDWINYWLENFIKNTVRPSTYCGYEVFIRIHIVPYIGHYKMCDLNLCILQDFFNSKNRISPKDKTPGRLSEKTVRNMRNMMSYAFSKAQESGVLLHDVLKGVVIKPVPKPKIRVLTPIEQDKLIVNVRNNLYDSSSTENPDKWLSGFAIIFDLFTGLREGELLGLRWMDIDINPNNPVIHVRHSLNRDVDVHNETNNNTILRLSVPKTENSIRDVPIIPNLYNDLIQYKNIQTTLKTEKGLSQNPTDFVFPNKNFTAYEPRGFYTKCKKLFSETKLRDVNVHSLRHTFATRSLEQGMDIKALSKILGHARPSITLDRYGDSLRNHQRDCINKLSNIYINT